MVDVDDEDAADVKSAVLEGIALDEQILKATQGYPVYFHASMISDLKSSDEPAEVEQERRLEAAEGLVWNAKFQQLQEQVAADVQLTQRAAHRHRVLQDRYLRHNYFTSNYPHHDIYTFCYWQIFWHSI